jgi:transcriptional antiterminator RfaH
MIKLYAPRKADLMRQEVMFPRYLFCQPAYPEQSIAPIRSTTGVLTLVRFGNLPAVLGEDIVAHIRSIEAHEQARDSADLSGLQVGAAVRVVAGPLATLEGIVSMVADGRVSVLFDLLGKPLHLTLGLEQIRAH